MLTRSSVEREWYGNLANGAGQAVEVITLTNAERMRVRFITLGGIITSLHVPDRDGNLQDVALGFDSLDDYLHDGHFFGALIGRYANRIANARFSLGGQEYRLEANAPPNHLHGGSGGFHRVVWDAETFATDNEVGALLSYTSPDGDGGYPGALRVTVRYTLTPSNELIVDYAATSDRPTPVNFTQHSYFNLAAHDRGDVLGHQLTINASRFTPVDAALIPTGELRSVARTPFDFREPQQIGARIDDDDEQLRMGRGYDHNFVLDRQPHEPASFAARLYEPTCGRMLEVFTTEPGIQLYSGNGLDDRVVGKQWRVYRRRNAVALETQHFPDSPNQPAFPSTILEPGREFRSRTIYKFSTHTEDRLE